MATLAKEAESRSVRRRMVPRRRHLWATQTSWPSSLNLKDQHPSPPCRPCSPSQHTHSPRAPISSAPSPDLVPNQSHPRLNSNNNQHRRKPTPSPPYPTRTPALAAHSNSSPAHPHQQQRQHPQISTSWAAEHQSFRPCTSRRRRRVGFQLRSARTTPRPCHHQQRNQDRLRRHQTQQRRTRHLLAHLKHHAPANRRPAIPARRHKSKLICC